VVHPRAVAHDDTPRSLRGEGLIAPTTVRFFPSGIGRFFVASEFLVLDPVGRLLDTKRPLAPLLLPPWP
jgi:hypothetical protein